MVNLPMKLYTTDILPYLCSSAPAPHDFWTVTKKAPWFKARASNIIFSEIFSTNPI